MSGLKTALRFFLFLLLLWGCGYVAFLVHLNGLSVKGRTQKTDAIVILTGGNYRIQTGLDLFAQGLAPKLFITGVHETVTEQDLLLTWKATPPLTLPACCIILGHKATTTYENAQETKEWIAKNQITSIRLVTSRYHMPRALLEFQSQIPDLEILAHPVEEMDYSPQELKYWTLSFSEYNKALFRKISLILSHRNTP